MLGLTGIIDDILYLVITEDVVLICSCCILILEHRSASWNSHLPNTSCPRKPQQLQIMKPRQFQSMKPQKAQCCGLAWPGPQYVASVCCKLCFVSFGGAFGSLRALHLLVNVAIGLSLDMVLGQNRGGPI